MFVAGCHRVHNLVAANGLGVVHDDIHAGFHAGTHQQRTVSRHLFHGAQDGGINRGNHGRENGSFYACNINLMHLQNVLKAHRVFRIRSSLVRGDPFYEIGFVSSMPPMTVLVLPMSIAKIIGGTPFNHLGCMLYFNMDCNIEKEERQPEESYVKRKDSPSWRDRKHRGL